MKLICQLLILSLLLYGVISGDADLSAPVVIPILLEVVNNMEEYSKGDDQNE